MSAEDAVTYLLGELDAGERRAFEAAMAEDPELRAEVERLRGAIDALETLPREAWEMAEPPPLRIAALPARTMADPEPAGPVQALAPAPAPVPLRRSRRFELRPALAALSAAALLIVGVGIGVLVGRGTQDGGTTTTQVRTVAEHTLQPVGTRDPQASGRVFIAQAGAGKREVKLHVDGLPRTGGDAFYELWLLGDDGQLVALGTFRVDPKGNATVQVPLAVDPSNFRYFDISRQPNNGDPKHSGDSVLRGETRS